MAELIIKIINKEVLEIYKKNIHLKEDLRHKKNIKNIYLRKIQAIHILILPYD